MRTDRHNRVAAAAFVLAFGLSVPSARADVAVTSRPASSAATQQANAYLAKGQLSLTLGKAGAAAADLEKAVRLKPTNAYSVLWLHFARNKEGAPDQVELQLNAARVNRAVWPGPLLDYLTGKIDATTALAKAGEGDDKTKAMQLCEANLFLGQEQLTKGRRSEGLDRLQAAANACGAPSREAQLARADLPGGGPAAQAQNPTKPVLTPVSNPAPAAAPRAKPLPGETTVKPASIAPESVRPPLQTLAQADPLLRGSLR